MSPTERATLTRSSRRVSALGRSALADAVAPTSGVAGVWGARRAQRSEHASRVATL